MGARPTKSYAIFTEPKITNHNFNWTELIADVLLRQRGRRLTAADAASIILTKNPNILETISKVDAKNRINATLQRMAINGMIKTYSLKKKEKK